MPVYKDKVRGTWFYEGSFINIFGESERYKKRGFQSSTLAKEAERKAGSNREAYMIIKKRLKNS